MLDTYYIYTVSADGLIEEIGFPIPFLTRRRSFSELILLLLNANAVGIELFLNSAMYLSECQG